MDFGILVQGEGLSSLPTRKLCHLWTALPTPWKAQNWHHIGPCSIITQKNSFLFYHLFMVIWGGLFSLFPYITLPFEQLRERQQSLVSVYLLPIKGNVLQIRIVTILSLVRLSPILSSTNWDDEKKQHPKRVGRGGSNSTIQIRSEFASRIFTDLKPKPTMLVWPE